MNKLSIKEASKKLEISPTQCRYWSKLLEVEIIKQGRISYIQSDAEGLFHAMKKAVEGGQAPSVAAIEVKATFVRLPTVPTVESQDNKRLEQLEKAIMLLAEANNKLTESNNLLSNDNKIIIAGLKAQGEVIARQSMQLNRLTLKLLPEPPKVQKKAIAKVSFIKKLWLEMFNPEALRAIP